MTRFAIYAQKHERPKKGAWPPLRIFAWTLLWSALFFWGWVFVTTRAG